MTVVALVSSVAQAGTPIDGLIIRDGGTRIGPVGWKALELNCGQNMTCSQSGTVATLSCTASVDGGAFGPVDAQYWTGAANATLTAEKNLGALGTGLVINTAGVPSAYTGTSCTNQFPRSLSASGAATCATVTLGTDTNTSMPYLQVGAVDAGIEWCTDYQGVRVVADAGYFDTCTCGSLSIIGQTCSTGSLLQSLGGSGASCTNQFAGGTSPQVQYNNSGALGGMSEVESSGGRLSLVDEAGTTPGTSDLRTGIMAYVQDAGFPPVLLLAHPTMGSAVAGTMGAWPNIGSQANWVPTCLRPVIFNSSTTYGGLNMLSTQYTSGGATTATWATTNMRTRQKWTLYSSSTSANSVTGIRDTSVQHWPGNAGGTGGYLMATRWMMATGLSASRLFIGLGPASNVGAANPSAQTNVVYIGCDATDTNLNACSNDGSGTATCNSLGNSFPCSTSGGMYDAWIFAEPGGGAYDWYVERLDSAASASGRITSDLPSTSNQYAWQMQCGNAANSGTSCQVGFGGYCVWDQLN
jgi:hypothetical protein